jgi:hypothetical protein
MSQIVDAPLLDKARASAEQFGRSLPLLLCQVNFGICEID